MIKMQSPKSNRNGVYEIHDVPSRRAEALRAQGWVEVKSKKKPALAAKNKRNNKRTAK